MRKITAVTLMLLFIATTNTFAYEFSNTKNETDTINSVRSANESTGNPLRSRLFMAQTATYATSRSACGSWWRDSSGKTECCAESERAVCYSNGGCQCERDPACASNTTRSCPF